MLYKQSCSLNVIKKTNKTMSKEAIEKLIEEHRLNEAFEIVNKKLKSESNKSIEILFLAGKISMMQQKYGDALNFYYSVLELEPDNFEAQAKISSIRGILNISNSFYFENTYLDDGLYE